MESRPQLSLLRTLIGTALCGLIAAPAPAQSFLTKEEALRLCFPEPMTIERRTVFLTNDETQTIEEQARASVSSKLVTYYRGVDSGKVYGYAFIETNVVRTMPQTLLIHVSPEAVIRSVELLAFHEPPDYRAPQGWLDILKSRHLDGELWLKRGIHNIAGATITAQTTIATLRRVLATYETAIAKKE